MKVWKSTFRGIALAAGLLGCVAAEPLQAYAAEGAALQMAGVEAMLEFNLSKEEYIAVAKQAQGALWGYTNLGIACQESGNLNVRQEPSTSGKLVGKMRKDAACEILEEEDGWAHITSGEVEGYVSTDFLLTGPDAKIYADSIVTTVAVSQTDGLNVRSKADTKSTIMAQVGKGEELDYVETMDEWVKVSLDGEDAYVSADYVTVETKLDTAITMTELLYGQGVSDVRVDLVEYAKQFLGNPYVWGGTSLTKGADCSGFVLSVFKKYGVTLPHHSVAQSKMGTKISASDLLPGDLVFYSNGSGSINHVAIYIGGGQVIHASNPKSGIRTNKYTYRTPTKYVRILQD